MLLIKGKINASLVRISLAGNSLLELALLLILELKLDLGLDWKLQPQAESH